ncbi:ADP-ribosylation factor-like protein 9 [Collichthys lucidus]|uniref:ADP-ribosylation factor-like protein 9 n=1 Tax=Collichthys lucidus TaxID=240159 RepID=A0A4U5V7F9_COLLU|nr:ADP-ribosylation factor-like protein 9 [Collichthys lucidus]
MTSAGRPLSSVGSPRPVADPCAPHMVLLRHISIALTAAVAALGSALFIALNFFYKRRIWSPQAEYCTIKEEEEERGKRQVLVLGLDGAGKSSMLQGLTPGESTAKRGRCRPTRGFNFMSLNAPACQLDFLEIGGGEDLRRYWLDYLRKTHVLVYVVDSSDRNRLPLAKAELHRLLSVDHQLPVVVLGNKQDKPNAVSVSELHEALSLGSVSDDRKLFLLAAQLDSDGALRNSCRGLDTIQDLLLQLI